VSLWILSRSASDLASALRVPWPAHLVALLVVALEVTARGARVWCVARGLGVPLSLAGAVRAQLAGDALGAVTPSRVGVDPAKLTVYRRHGVRTGVGGALILAELGSEAAVLILCSAVIALAASGMRWVALGLFGYAAIITSAGVAALVLFRPPGTDPPRLWSWLRLGPGRWAGLRRAIEEFRTNAKGLRSLSPRWGLAVLGVTLLHMAARVAILPILVLAFAGVGTPSGSGVFEAIVLRSFFVLYATALLPPPGGGGGVEFTFAAVLSGTLGADALAATVLWWRLYTFYLSAAVGGLLLFLPRFRARQEGDDPADEGEQVLSASADT